jgi:hypothetical protein
MYPLPCGLEESGTRYICPSTSLSTLHEFMSVSALASTFMTFVIGISLKAIKSSETSLDKLTMSDLSLAFSADSL